MSKSRKAQRVKPKANGMPRRDAVSVAIRSSTKPEQWSIAKAALCGALLGGPSLWAGKMLFKHDLPTNPAEIVGFLLGGALLMSLLCVMAVAVRNALVQR
jgi:ABC-type enterobactin transport system permease subunit